MDTEIPLGRALPSFKSRSRPADASAARAPRNAKELEGVALPPLASALRRAFTHPYLMHYNRLTALVLMINLAVFWRTASAGGLWAGNAPGSLLFAAQLNFALAVIVRNQYLHNALFWITTKTPTHWPLTIRWPLAKIYQFGGLHVGGALSGLLWYGVFVASLTELARTRPEAAPTLSLVLSYILVGMFVVMVVMALPPMRARFHDRFEFTHRFFGWASVVLVWVNNLAFLIGQRGDSSVFDSLRNSPAFWVLVATTISSLMPWMRLRKVRIDVVKPSNHAVLVSLDYGESPLIGSARPISRHPLFGWHSFACLPPNASRPSAYRMVISRAGDWTGEFVDSPPSHVWVRGVAVAGVGNVRRMFKRVVYVATGSGIAPILGHLLANEVPARLVWVTRDPRKTYGDALVDEILAVEPGAVIWNTDELGKPDMVRLAYSAYQSSGAEAVICLSNKALTWKIVHGLERRGVPAFGPVWDS